MKPCWVSYLHTVNTAICDRITSPTWSWLRSSEDYWMRTSMPVTYLRNKHEAQVGRGLALTPEQALSHLKLCDMFSVQHLFGARLTGCLLNSLECFWAETLMWSLRRILRISFEKICTLKKKKCFFYTDPVCSCSFLLTGCHLPGKSPTRGAGAYLKKSISGKEQAVTCSPHNDYN